MSEQMNEAVNLGREAQKELQPVQRFINLILHQATLDNADKLELSLTGCLPKLEFRISQTYQGKMHQLAPPPASLFDPVIVCLCNYASVPYYAKGPVRGRLETKNPDSFWLLEAEDLKKTVVLSRQVKGTHATTTPDS